jgi:hypothetical protein
MVDMNRKNVYKPPKNNPTKILRDDYFFRMSLLNHAACLFING